VQEPCAACLGFKDALHAIGVQGGKGRIVDDHRKMEDAEQRLAARADLLHQAVEVR